MKTTLTPPYFHHPHQEFILLTSLNLGGAEKIVSDQLWANYYSKFPTQYTLIVIYDKEKEHSLPPNINIIRLNGDINNGKLIFQQIAFENKLLVCHLINDKVADYLFSLNVNISIVVHNDKRSWSTTPLTLNHPQTHQIISICQFVTTQLKEVCHKPIITLRHQIKYHQYLFNSEQREYQRKLLNFSQSDIVIGMVGRICEQKNYPLAIDSLFHLTKTYPEKSFKLVILGGFEKSFYHVYLNILKKINEYKLHDKVRLLGFRKDVSSIINSFDIALNSSYFEGLSMATQELMSNGLPIVLSKVCGQPEIYDKNNQLSFFDIPESCQTLQTNTFNYFNASSDYKNLIEDISSKINHTSITMTRIKFSDENLSDISKICYGSHRAWILLNHLPLSNHQKTIKKKTAFVTANLNLGGAQRSLCNLLTYISENYSSQNPHLILTNQSNQTSFFKQIIDSGTPYFLCHKSIDVFDIMKNLMRYIQQENINQLIFWNIESKLKILISKFLSPYISIIDVSPGDYIFNEISNEKLFQEALYFYKDDYFSTIDKFVSKFSISKNNSTSYTQILNNKTTVIPNGVYFDKSFEKTTHYLNNNLNSEFKFLICGRIAPSKHLGIIFEAFKQLFNHYQKQYTEPQISLHVVGEVEPYYQNYLNDLLKNYNFLINGSNNFKIIFDGYVDNPQTIMKDYDCLIVLGTYQGSPNTVLEAATTYLPIIANDSGGTKEIINENTGILLPETPDVNNTLIAMIDMFENYSQYVQKSINCYDLVQYYFSMNTMSEKYLKIIKNN